MTSLELICAIIAEAKQNPAMAADMPGLVLQKLESQGHPVSALFEEVPAADVQSALAACRADRAGYLEILKARGLIWE
jgi:hypothetical protein